MWVTIIMIVMIKTNIATYQALFVDNKKTTITEVIANFTEQILITRIFLGTLHVMSFIPFNNS